jgi:uncharacterized membrane protein
MADTKQNVITNDVVTRNIRSLLEVRQKHETDAVGGERLAVYITRFIGRMDFVYINVIFFGTWLALNQGSSSWDPYPFPMLGTLACIEAIFLATFVLIGQNRLNRLAEKRADLDVQISLLTEHELTQLIRLTDAVACHLGVRTGDVTNLEELKKDVEPQELLDQIEKEEQDLTPK